MKCWHAARKERGEGRSKYEGLWCVEDKREAKFFLIVDVKGWLGVPGESTLARFSKRDCLVAG
jgi:hypothetical protein